MERAGAWARPSAQGSGAACSPAALLAWWMLLLNIALVGLLEFAASPVAIQRVSQPAPRSGMPAPHLSLTPRSPPRPTLSRTQARPRSL